MPCAVDGPRLCFGVAVVVGVHRAGVGVVSIFVIDMRLLAAASCSGRADAGGDQLSGVDGGDVVSWSPWNTINGTVPVVDGVDPPLRMAVSPAKRPFAAPWANPECTPTAAYSSG